MNKDLNLEKIKEFHKNYINNKDNLEIETNIKNNGIKNAIIDTTRLNEFSYKFNIEIPEVKIYNQKNSYQCNIYAFLRVIKSTMNKKYRNIDLSANYIEFYDKLEKVNSLYNSLLNEEELTLEIINQKVNRYIGIYGTFHFCREIVNKYGLVPNNIMKEASNNYNAVELIELLRAKIKTDALCLLNKNYTEKSSLKDTLIQEAYTFLAKVMTHPPIQFKYKNKTYTPIDFKNKILKTDLSEFITITPFNKKDFLNSNDFIPNVYLKNNEEIHKLSIEKIKDAVLAQLKDGIAIWFSSEESTTLDYNINILDENLYQYEKLLGIKDINKNKELLLDLINYDHAMTITGALLKNNEIKQFKVDNSFGYHGKYKGYLIMSTDFFENKVITFIINKKYLN